MSSISALVQDIVNSARSLRRTPLFTAAALLVLTIGLSAAALVFSVAYSSVLRSLAFPNGDRLTWITTGDRRAASPSDGIRMSQYLAWRERADQFDTIAAWNAFFSMSALNLTGAGDPERLNGVAVSPSLFTIMATRPAAGRLLTAGDEQPGAPRVVLLTYGFWQRKFGGDLTVIGRPLTINGQPTTIVGILPTGDAFADTFYPGTTFDVYLPLVRDPSNENLGFYLAVIGRLTPGGNIASAIEQLNGIQQQLAAERSFMAEFEQQVEPLGAHITATVRRPLLMLLAGVLCLLIVSCANLANLQLARMNARRRDLAIRAALGADRGRLVREGLLETVLLSLTAGAIGLVAARLALPILIGSSSTALPRIQDLQVGVVTVAFIVGICSVSGLIIGWLGTWQAGRVQGITAMRGHGPAGGLAPTVRIQRTLAVVQVALAFVLLGTAGLLIRSFSQVLEVDPGFRPDNVVAMRLDPGNRYPRGVGLDAFFARVEAEVSTLPGVESAALAMNLPLDRRMMWDVNLPGRTYEQGTEPPVAMTQLVRPGYFRTIGVPLLSGRDFTLSDHSEALSVVIINETLARQLLGGVDVLGARVQVGGREREIVAVAGDVRHDALDTEPGPQMYLPQMQIRGFTAMDLVVRTFSAPDTALPAVRAAVWAIERTQTIGRPFLLSDRVSQATQSRGALATASGALGLFTLALAAVGLYGLLAYLITTRQREIGVRMAIGASRSHVVRMVLSQGVTLILAGVGVGVLVSLAVNRLLRGLLFGVEASDPWSYAIASLTLALVVLTACAVPAWRASRVDPLVALRAE